LVLPLTMFIRLALIIMVSIYYALFKRFSCHIGIFTYNFRIIILNQCYDYDFVLLLASLHNDLQLEY
jgi:hypothetical protein